jgi:hypothetical protein
MKLLLCELCGDVFSLRKDARYCKCGENGGRYVDNINVEVWGTEAIVLGFANNTLMKALSEQKQYGDLTEKMGGIYGNQVMGRPFTAFIIPESASSVRTVLKPE